MPNILCNLALDSTLGSHGLQTDPQVPGKWKESIEYKDAAPKPQPHEQRKEEIMPKPRKTKSPPRLSIPQELLGEDIRSQIIKTIVREVMSSAAADAGTYTKPDSFQDGQYGKYERGDLGKLTDLGRPISEQPKQVGQKAGQNVVRK